MKRISTFFVVLTTVLSVSFTSCKSGDDDEPVNSEIKELVSAKLPDEGWSGDPDNGILKFAPDAYEEDEANSYFAFKMKDGICQSSVYNIVMSSSIEARQIAKLFNNGTWVDEDDDDDDYYDYYAPGLSNQALLTAKRIIHFAKLSAKTRASFTLPIKVNQEGKVIYISLPNFVGLSSDDLRTAVNLWNGESYEVPQRVVFGKYVNGTYKCQNMHGMDITYEISTDFNSAGYCTKYTTTLTLPSQNWARFYYEAYDEQLDDFESQFGKRPELTINGNVVRLDAIIIGDVTRDQVDNMIYTIDWFNNCPFIFNIF